METFCEKKRGFPGNRDTRERLKIDTPTLHKLFLDFINSLGNFRIFFFFQYGYIVRRGEIPGQCFFFVLFNTRISASKARAIDCLIWHYSEDSWRSEVSGEEKPAGGLGSCGVYSDIERTCLRRSNLIHLPIPFHPNGSKASGEEIECGVGEGTAPLPLQFILDRGSIFLKVSLWKMSFQSVGGDSRVTRFSFW